ncbi:MAG: DUF1993 domain-containing protein [Steroidobacteraceae bacterium]|jgi:hypothetical protein|nr:DUF1993 domain-containing protein [Steroidobacteraceae bacterium]
MPISLYQASVPPFVQQLKALRGVLAKAKAHAEASKVAPEVFLQARLYPNMFALTRQVQIATDFAKGCAARLAGLEPPKFEDTETTFEQLEARIDRTLEFLATFAPAQIDGQEERVVELKVGGQLLSFKGQPYLVNFVLPNFYFHATTAYAILRHNGVELGKRDFVGEF